VAQASDGRYYYILQAAYTSDKACGEYQPPEDDPGTGINPNPPVSQIIIPVKIATPDAEGKVYHIVKSGQSFWSIAIAYQITIRDLEVWNNISKDNGLFVGQKLFIPSGDTEGYATPTPVGLVLLATPDDDGRIVHEVQPYQALIPIAETYNVQLNTILALNGLQAEWPLSVGQKLLIDPGRVTPSLTPRPLSAIEQLTPANDGNYYHTVKSGEYLAWIADLYEVSLDQLLAWNGLTSASVIRPEQQLLLLVTPPATATSTPALPSTTPTLTTTPKPTISIQGLATSLPALTAPVEEEVTSSFSRVSVLLLVGLVVVGIFVLGWVKRWWL
jgi:LysM repeat protein